MLWTNAYEINQVLIHSIIIDLIGKKLLVNTLNLQGIMKIVNFKGGLGNQVFQYLMCLYLKEKHPNERICGYYNPAFLKNHNGLEVQNVFDLELPNQTKWSTLVTLFARGASRIVKGLKAEDKTFHENAIYYDGWWQDKRFFLNNVNKLEFKDFCLDTINTQILNEIENKNSVSLHVRRGDYLTPKNKKIYATNNLRLSDFYLSASGGFFF